MKKTSLLATQQKKIDNIIGVKADVIEALQKEFSKNNVSVDIDAQTGALTLNANVLFDYDKSELTDEGKQELADILPIYCKVLFRKIIRSIWLRLSLTGYTGHETETMITIWSFLRNVLSQLHSI